MAEPTAPAAPPASPGAPPGRLTLIGAGHVFQIGPAILGAVHALRPDVVFVELDRGRLQALVERARGGSPPPARGLVHRWLAGFQEAVAGMYGADVGAEMLAAVQGARDVGARLDLVDDAADLTIRRALAQLTWRERLRGLGMAAGSALASLWPPRRRRARQDIERELARYQRDPEALLEEMRRRFPTVHRVAIAERDARMAARMRAGLAGARHGLAVVGDGHVGGLLRHLADLRPEVFRLEAVRAGRLPRPGPVATGTTSSVGFTVEWRGDGGRAAATPPPKPSPPPKP